MTLLILYIIGVIVSFALIFFSETKDKESVSMSELLLFLAISLGSWVMVCIWLVEEYKIFKRIENALTEIKIPLKRKVQK